MPCTNSTDDSVPWDDLDPGIRRVVRLLVDNGFATCDSGDGRSKFGPDGLPLEEWRSDVPGMDWVMDVPHVVAQVEPGNLVRECDRMRAVLETLGIEVGAQDPDGVAVAIQGTYDPCSRYGFVMLVGLTDDALP